MSEYGLNISIWLAIYRLWVYKPEVLWGLQSPKSTQISQLQPCSNMAQATGHPCFHGHPQYLRNGAEVKSMLDIVVDIGRPRFQN